MTDAGASAAARRVLAGVMTVGLMGSAVAFVAGSAHAQDGESAFVVGGARGPGIPWYDYTNRAGRGYFPGVDRTIVPYPAGMAYGHLPDQLWPGTDLATDSVGESVVTGRSNLDSMIRANRGDSVAIGLSEGTLVLNAEQRRLAHDPSAPAQDQLSFTHFSSPVAVHGFGRSVMAMFAPGTFVPIIDYTVPAPVESQYHTNLVVAEYDGLADFPDGNANLLSLANAAVGAMTVHTPAAFTTPADVPPENIVTTTNSLGGTTTTYLIPAKQLPLTQPLRDAGVPPAMVDQLDAALRPEVDAGYSRHGGNPAPTIVIDPVDQANVENAVRQLKVSTTDQANIEQAVQQVQQVKLNHTEQANLDNAVQQARGLLPGLG